MFITFSLYFHNFFHINFTINPKWQVVTGGQESNFSGRIKLKLITTCHLGFVVKVLLLGFKSLEQLANCEHKFI